MPRFGVPTSQLQNLVEPPPGIYTVRLKGFKPKFTKDKQSYNFNPHLVIVAPTGEKFRCSDPDCELKHGAGHELNDCRAAFVNLNSKPQAFFIARALSHMLGFNTIIEQDPDAGEEYENFVGKFSGDEQNPDSWVYSGPLIDASTTGQLEVAKGDKQDAQGNIIGQKNIIKQYFCKIPGCQEKHPTNLAG